MLLALGGCAQNPTPPFASLPYAPFSRTNAVAITLGEWRLWGRRVDDAGGASYVHSRQQWPSVSRGYGSASACTGGSG